MRMHADEVHTDVPLVRRLLAGQFPQWADLPLERVASSGTDNALYRLGDDMVVQLPRRASCAEWNDRHPRGDGRVGCSASNARMVWPAGLDPWRPVTGEPALPAWPADRRHRLGWSGRWRPCLRPDRRLGLTLA